MFTHDWGVVHALHGMLRDCFELTLLQFDTTAHELAHLWPVGLAVRET